MHHGGVTGKLRAGTCCVHLQDYEGARIRGGPARCLGVDDSTGPDLVVYDQGWPRYSGNFTLICGTRLSGALPTAAGCAKTG